MVQYFLGALKWSQRDLRGLDRVTRRILRKYQAQHHASVARVYLPRRNGGRGLQSIKMLYERERPST